jgi:phosphatidylglycerol:prolipoprotein diacylglycerol transferase
MIPYFSYTQIHLGPITLYAWGLFLGLAFLISFWLALKEAGRKEIDQKKIFWLIIFVFLGGLVGSRLAYLLQFPEYYLSHPGEIFQVWAGGLMFYGGLLGALIVGWFYIRKNRLNFWPIADALAPAIALGIFIGRIGCSLINDHQGAVTNLPWAILWPDGILRHPVAEYLALNGLIMFMVLWLLRTRLKKPGQLFIIFLLWYNISRFLLDFTRATATSLADPHYWGLTISQWVSLFILIGLAIFLIKKTYIKRAIIK